MNADINPYSSPKVDVDQPVIILRSIVQTAMRLLRVSLLCAGFGFLCATLTACAMVGIMDVIHTDIGWLTWNPGGVYGQLLAWLSILGGFLSGAWMMYRAEYDGK